MKQIVMAMGMMALVACADTDKTPPETDAPVQDIDPFALAIETGRWEVMIDNGLRAHHMFQSPQDESEAARSDRSLKAGARRLLDLRDQLCGAGVVDRDSCDGLALPAWVTAYSGEMPDLAELQRRSDWLGEALGPFEAAACSQVPEAERMSWCGVE